MTEKLWNVRDAASERLGGVSYWTVYSWLSKKKLRKTRVGGRVMIAESDIQDFLAKCNPETPASPEEG